MRLQVPSLALLSGVAVVAVSCGVSHRHGSDPPLLWLWRQTMVIAPMRPLAWEPPYATGPALEKDKKQKQTPKSSIHIDIPGLYSHSIQSGYLEVEPQESGFEQAP